MAAEIRISITTSKDGGLSQVKQDIADLGQAAKSSGGGFSALREVATGALREIGSMGVGFAVEGFKALGGAIMDGISDAKEAAKINAQTAAVIQSTGNAAGTSAQHVQDYAAALSAAAGKSLFGDSQIQESTNLLLTFTNIKGTVLDAATAISVDMAQALGGAPKDAAIQLGKALNDPIKGITALTRVGVTFSEDQKDMIQAMVETGDVAGAQQVILAELNKEFGGSAEAAAKADGGWAQFNDRLGEAKETIGAAVLPLLSTLVGFLNDSIMPAVEAAAAAFGDFIAAFQTGAEGGDWLGGITNALYSLDSISPVFDTIADGILRLAQSFEEGGIAGLINDIFYSLTGIQGVGFVVADAINNIIGAFQDAGPASLEFAEAVGQISPIFGGILQVAAEVLPNLQALVQQVLGDIVAHFSDSGGQMLAQAQATWQSISSTITALANAIAPVVNAVLAQISAFWRAHGAEIMAFVETTWSQINEIIQVAMKLIQATIVPVLKAIAAFINAHGDEIQTILSNTWTIISSVIDAALTLIKGIITAALQLVQGDFSGAWNTIQAMSARFVQDLLAVIQSFLQIIETLFSSAWAKIISDVTGAWATIVSGVKSGLESVVSAIVGFASDVTSAAAQIGDAIIDGIVGGIQDGVGAIIDAARNAAEDALNAAKSALGISSPSKAFQMIGQWGAEGMAIGLAQGAPMVAGAGAGVAAASLAGAAKTYNQQRSVTYAPTVYTSGRDDRIDFSTAMSLAGV